MHTNICWSSFHKLNPKIGNQFEEIISLVQMYCSIKSSNFLKRVQLRPLNMFGLFDHRLDTLDSPGRLRCQLLWGIPRRRLLGDCDVALSVSARRGQLPCRKQTPAAVWAAWLCCWCWHWNTSVERVTHTHIIRQKDTHVARCNAFLWSGYAMAAHTSTQVGAQYGQDLEV